MGRVVIADFCYQTGPLTQLKRLDRPFLNIIWEKPLQKGVSKSLFIKPIIYLNLVVSINHGPGGSAKGWYT